MNSRIAECIDNNYGSYILPFLWLHGESHEKLRREMVAIKNSGVTEFCAESRPYEDFCQKSWWEDFEFILKTAKELDMKVWLLDDQKFPSGYANGYLESPENAHLRKVQIRERQSEVAGPLKKVKIPVGGWLDDGHDEEIISVIAYRHNGSDEELDYTSAVNLTSSLKNGMVYWDVPDGIWRVCVTIRTDAQQNKDSRFAYYIDMLNNESCRAMIEAVYRPHYEKFGEYFGTTFAGFFSDEPGFLNMTGTYYNTTGIMHEPYPWRDDLPALIAQSAGIDTDEIENAIPALWEDLGDITSAVRMHYMEVITGLFRENFSYTLGNWCREHGVMYIGHVIEDSNAHMRTGYGCGHFFRALDGQDMAGMDIVLMQIIPGITGNAYRIPCCDRGYARPEFFYYTLPKMTASHAHLQPLKKGRALCEIFGAFGWAEGLTHMKNLADIMLISGINHFVPHAFSPKENDRDCPPHFYNNGKNIQYPLFKNLMQYMSRTSHILCGGTHKASVAVFYNAEGEWSGGKNELFQNVCANLTRNLIDFDIVPIDILKQAEVKDTQLVINSESFDALIISESEIMPYDRLECFAGLAEKGVKIIFTNSLPVRSAEGKSIDGLTDKFEAVPTAILSQYLRENGIYEISADDGSHLRFYHITCGSEDIYMFQSDSFRGKTDTWVSLPNTGEYLIYDAWRNKCSRGKTESGKLRLALEGSDAVIIAFGSKIPENIPEAAYETERQRLDLKFDIYIKQLEDNEFKKYLTNSECVDISSPERIPGFCGEVKYETLFRATPGYTVLDLGEVGETAEVWLNGEYLGAKINAPYKFDISAASAEKENTLVINVRSSLAHRNSDDLSCYIHIPPTGIIGDIYECRYSNKAK